MQDTRWDLKYLRDLVERRWGKQQRQLLASCLDSVNERFNFARYHYSEAQRLLKTAAGGRDEEEMFVVLMWADPASGDFERSRIQAAANVVACVQSLHAVTDTLAHVIYYATAMNLDADRMLSEAAINMKRVRRRLPAGKLSSLIDELLTHADYQFFSDMNNFNKHRSLIQTPYSLDFASKTGPTQGLTFSSFSYDGRPYKERWVAPALESEYNRQDRLLVFIGQQLNVAAGLPI